jgi:tripartite-type tricarboxylate transporter receptor subunit TctC
LHALIIKALKTPEVIQKLRELGAEPVGNTPAEFQKFVADEVTSWKQTVKAANIQAQ